MGQCASEPQVQDAGRASYKDASGHSAAGQRPATPPDAAMARAAASKRSTSISRELSMRMDTIAKVHALQQELALLASPLLAIPEAAELLLSHLGVDLVAIYAYPDEAEPGNPPSASLMAAHGAGAALLERSVAARGNMWSAVRVCGGDGSAAGRLVVHDASKAADLPADFELLRDEAGLQSFVAAPIGPPGSEALGALLLGRSQPGGFDDVWCALWLSASMTGLLHHMRPAQVAHAARILQKVDGAPDPVAAISVLLQGGTRFMWRAVNIAMGVRIALIDEAGRGALIFEYARAARRKHEPMDASMTVALPQDPTCDVTVKEVPLANTLLASAVAQKKARFVKDCASYMQNCPTPARDVFTHATEPVSSVVVVPLLVADRVLGALYFTQDTPCDFSNIQDALLGFVHAVTLALHNKLSGQIGLLRTMLQRARNFSGPLPLNGAAKCGKTWGGDSLGDVAIVRELESSESACTASDADGRGSDARASSDAAAPAASGRLSKVSSNRLCTEAMLKVLQQEIRKGKRRSVELSFVADHLAIYEPIGRGGFGRVYRGSWHKRPAAIKVMNARSTDSEAVSDAMEMAVLSTVNHPNIVQVYSCLTDMVEAPPAGTNDLDRSVGSGSGSGGATPRMPRYRRMSPSEDEAAAGPTYNIVVMEYMDKGTLGEQVRRAGLFHRRLSDGSIGVNLASVLDILLDVANSLSYLHGIKLLHGDVKLDNVLLRTDALRPMGFIPKLADFGLAKMIKDSDHVINHTGAGTVTHLAPEMFKAGSQLTTAVDVYAFGVLMWEFYTAKRPWAGLSPEAIADRVMRKGMRPLFPAGAPRQYASLATRCWAQHPSDRPQLAQVCAELGAMADVMAPAGAPAAAAAAY